MDFCLFLGVVGGGVGGQRYYLVAVTQASIFWSCVKVEVAALVFPSQIVCTVSKDIKQH